MEIPLVPRDACAAPRGLLCLLSCGGFAAAALTIALLAVAGIFFAAAGAGFAIAGVAAVAGRGLVQSDLL